MALDLYAINQYLAGTVSIVFNSVLLYLVVGHTPNYMKDMRYSLSNLALSDLILGLIGLICQFRLKFERNYILFLISGPARSFNCNILVSMFGAYVALECYSFMCLPLNFIQRHKIVSRRTSISLIQFPKWEFFRRIALMAIVSFLIGIALILSPVTEDYVNQVSKFPDYSNASCAYDAVLLSATIAYR